MVIQQGIPAPIWGWAAPGEQVTVRFAGQVKQTEADKDGRWEVRLDSMPAHPEWPGRIMRIEGKDSRLTVHDVLIGEVWVCSGQSNMQFGVISSNNGAEEVAQAKYPQIRLFTVPDVTAPAPVDDCAGQWAVCSPETVAGFSAVAYFFGRDLHQALKVPVGLINTSWGGTVAEAWTSAPALRAKLPEFNAELDKLAGPAADYDRALTEFRQKMADFNAAVLKLYDLEEDLTVAARYAAPGLDDHAWKTMDVPGNWEAKGLPDLDGIVVFRRTLQVPAAWAGKDLILRPGPVDEVETTWFNGEQVGARGRSRTRETQYWNQPREYRVPGRLVQAGANVVTIRVTDTTGAGGLWGAPADTMYAALAGGSDPTHLSLAGDWRYLVEYALPPRPGDPTNPNRPSVLFNAMISPLIPFGIRGAIWYQGESNAGRPAQYRTLLPAMIVDWRTRWGEGDFPFLIVQLANFMARNTEPEESQWAELREAQALTAERLPRTGLALAIDIGDAGDIHPRNKQEVGRRLALAAEAIAYGRKMAYSGPVYQAMRIEGSKVVLSFTHTEGGLVAKDGPLTGFALCGEDHKYVWAQAEIRGDEVVVWCDQIAKPVAVRYAWANNPACNLYNGAGLPAVPFRTDQP
jgi:sialate O-acetylesterase